MLAKGTLCRSLITGPRQGRNEELDSWLASALKSVEERIDAHYGELEAVLDRRFDAAERRVEQFAAAAGMRSHDGAGANDLDRKRIKVPWQQSWVSKLPCRRTLMFRFNFR